MITAPGALAAEHPLVANHLVSTGERRAARDVVRDVLLLAGESFRTSNESAPSTSGSVYACRDWARVSQNAGHELRPLVFDDPAVSDVLGEEDPAEWLASVGAIRHLWQRPSPEIARMKQLHHALREE